MEKYKDIIEKIEKLSMLELSELVKTMEEKFGVSAAAMAVPAQGGSAAGPEAEEKTAFTVELKSAGEQKIQVIKALREAVGLGLKEAKDLTDGAPKVVKEGVSQKEADELKAKLIAAGATVEIK